MANTDPIYSRLGNTQWQAPITAAANDYTCFSSLNEEIFDADDANGGYIQRIRFKALGTNVATVARVFVNNGLGNQQVVTASGTPTGTASASNGSIQTSSQYAKIVPIGVGGDIGAISTESSAVAVTGPTGSVLWSWTAPSGFSITAYRVHVGFATGAQGEYFYAPTTTFTGSQSTTVMTVTAILTCPDKRICPAISIGSVMASGIAAGVYVVNQLTSAEADGSYGRTGTYTVSTSATVGSTTCATDPLKYEQLIPAHQMNTYLAGVPQVTSYDGQPAKNNSFFYGEISLPATTLSASSATVDIDYPMALALDPGYEIYVGLGTAVAAGWQVGIVGGKY
jgi:hypothetical protein